MSAYAMKEITGRHVLIGLVIFFGIMFAANGVLVYLAVTTYEGADNPNAYQEGLDYNRRIAIAEAQSELGWTHAIKMAETRRLQLILRDKDGQPVHGVSLKGKIRRPVGDTTPALLQFSQDENGLFAAEVDALAPGNWIVSVVAERRGGEVLYRLKERVWLKPNS